MPRAEGEQQPAPLEMRITTKSVFAARLGLTLDL